MKKQMTIMLIFLAILFSLIAAWKIFQYVMMKHFMGQLASQTVTVSTMKVAYSNWTPLIKAVGSMRAIKGINVTTELAGMVQSIHFIPGSQVANGVLLVQLNADVEIAQLHSLQANTELAKITYNRDFAQYKIKAVSKQTVDADIQNWRSLIAQVAQQTAVVQKKTIRAPFGGRLGISSVNPGQYLNPGDKVVSLQMLDPIYVDFYLPQQALAEIKVGQTVTVTSDTHSGKQFRGKITTVDPAVDTTTRNVEVEATLPNPKFELTPGSFATVKVETGAPSKYITLPQTAITFNPYGNLVFVVAEDDHAKDKEGKPALTVKERFVTTGETRGDQIKILDGLKEGEVVVTSGQLKLKNGSRITVNNSVVPDNNPKPVVTDEE